jgi:IS30 family transposase
LAYDSIRAQLVAQGRKEKAFGAKQYLKNSDVYQYCIGHLRQGWSPEQIAGRLTLEHPNDPHWHICHETIYCFIYSKKYLFNRDHPLWEYLRRKQKRRRKQGSRKAHRLHIPDRVSIHERPVVIDQRIEPGHWEGDSIVGKGHLSGLHTEYERVFSLTRFERMERVNSDEMVKAAINIFSSFPEDLRRSTTLDNGSEHVEHLRLRQLGISTYFADPYSAYQRGGNENANLWIRYYFPKGTDFNQISDQELKDVEWELNNRPRKRLQYQTPQEALTKYLTRGCVR